MSPPIRIFVADRVPLANKGEEAIIRGIEDLLGNDGQSIELAVFDRQSHPTRQGNIKVFPVSWTYPEWGRKFGPEPNRWLRALEARWHPFLQYWRSGKQWLGYLGVLGNIARSADPHHVEMRSFFNQADYMLVGHDGVFNYEHCGILRAAKKAGKRAGILGVGGKHFRPASGVIASLYRRAVAESDFFVLRERGAYENLVKIGCSTAKLRLAPDPAFIMKPAPRENIQALLADMPWYLPARKHAKLVVAATVSHKGILLDRPFAQVRSIHDKTQLHSRYLARVFDLVIRERDVFVVFLPHSLEPGRRNDVEAAKGVTKMMQASDELYYVMDDDLPARTLKGIIRECDFLIGQRAHSLIGSAAVATPYVALTASNDIRTHDILGDMCGCEEQMVDMDRHKPDEAAAIIIQAIDRREELRGHLARRMDQFWETLADIKALVVGNSS